MGWLPVRTGRDGWIKKARKNQPLFSGRADRVIFGEVAVQVVGDVGSAEGAESTYYSPAARLAV
jgi:hypothetical protein